tara:strand:+ start:656 stop:1558 length:903 start_codon:yes stop_codon:yes gene_type:complete
MSKNSVLYCCYNRLNYVKKSLPKLKSLKIKKLYIAIDGPKNENDKLKCKKVEKFIKKLNFDYPVIYKIRKKNLGCKYGMSDSINWFFKKEKQGIILEDDIICSKDFIKFCDLMLNKYKMNKKIMMIGGTNYDQFINNSPSFFFSKHFLFWGWATWRSAWKKYDVEMLKWRDQKIKRKLRKKFSKFEYLFLQKRFNELHKNYKDTWDIQWYFACVNNDGLSVIPETNLITNIGVYGTHSNELFETLFLKRGKFNFKSLSFPKKIERNTLFDKRIYKLSNPETLLKKIVKKIIFWKLVKKFF